MCYFSFSPPRNEIVRIRSNLLLSIQRNLRLNLECPEGERILNRVYSFNCDPEGEENGEGSVVNLRNLETLEVY